MIETLVFNGRRDGPTVTMLGAIHGNEIAGTIALRALAAALAAGRTVLGRGRLVLVPVCNPMAHAQGRRYIDHDLNRLVGLDDPPAGAEAALVPHLQGVIRASDHLLDLHSTHTPGDPAFAFAVRGNPASLAWSKALGVETVLLDWEVIYGADDNSTEAYAIRHGGTGMTVECGYHNDPGAARVAARAVANTLRHLGLVDQPAEPPPPAPRLFRFVRVAWFEPGAALARPWRHLDQVAAGEVIHRTPCGDPVVAPEDGVILIPNPDPVAGDEFYYFGVPDTA